MLSAIILLGAFMVITVTLALSILDDSKLEHFCGEELKKQG